MPPEETAAQRAALLEHPGLEVVAASYAGSGALLLRGGGSNFWLSTEGRLERILTNAEVVAGRLLLEQPVVRCCEDCGEETARRRLRCPACKLLVCGWCFGHVHNRAPLRVEQAAS